MMLNRRDILGRTRLKSSYPFDFILIDTLNTHYDYDYTKQQNTRLICIEGHL